MSTTNIVEEKVIHELLKVINLDIATEDDEILIEALDRTLKEDVERLNLDLHGIVKKLKGEYFKKLREEFLDNLAKVRTERKQYIPEKQLMYLAATVFAESILKKPAPASLIFEILRCAGMEEEKNFPNRYYFLRELEKKGLIKSITLVNSTTTKEFYCPTEEGKKAIDGTKAFDILIKLQDKILQDSKVKKLIENYSREEPNIKVNLPKLLEVSQIISENEEGVKILMYGYRNVLLSWNEIERIDEIAKELGKFTQNALERAYGSQWKAYAYIVYAHHKGWIRLVERVGEAKNSPALFERVRNSYQ